jgi:predicted esterase
MRNGSVCHARNEACGMCPLSDLILMQTYIHRFIEGADRHRPPLLLLHRTGGNENDLIEDAARISPGAALLGLRGNVLEDGKPRFFRRIGKGNFDLEDLAQRTNELAAFIDWACGHYKLARPVVVGFSNGANIAMSLVLNQPHVLRAAILLRPMWAYEPQIPRPLNGFPVLAIAGQDDITVRPELARKVPAFLERAGAHATFKWARGGHEMTEDDRQTAAQWLASVLVDESHPT